MFYISANDARAEYKFNQWNRMKHAQYIIVCILYYLLWMGRLQKPIALLGLITYSKF